MKKAILLLAISIITFTSCSKEGGGNESPEVVILPPTAATLTFPANNEPCLETNSVNDTQSSVTFRWNAGQNVSSYDIKVINLSNNSSNLYNSTTNNKSLTLEHDEPYSWKVISNGESGTQPIESETWKFYLAGPAQVNFTPFPAELTSPISGSTVTPSDGLIQIQWTCIDVDNDLSQYEVYLDTTDGSTLINTIDYESNTTSIDVNVENNTIYYWKVVATDAEGNQSDSGVYSFRTN
ncbi:MAG: hypothetical protein ACPGC8_03620 [Flavobacteriaceae bacterium]